MGRIYAYGRTSPDDNEEEIRCLLAEMQVAEEDIYIDNVPKNQRIFPRYTKLLKKLESGDLLYLSSLSVLGDSYAEVKEQWRYLTREKRVDVIALDLPQVDTRRGKSQYGLLVADVVYSLLDYVADSDNNVRRSRQREGIAEARQKGIKFGRPAKQMPDNFTQIYNQWVSKEITGTEAARLCGVSRTVFYKKVKEMRGNLEQS